MADIRVFFSYSSRDWVLARLIIRIFEQNGLACFFAERDTSTGSLFDEGIAKNIWNSNVLLVLLTPNSVMSPWVHQEVGIARGQDIPIWPLAIDDIKIEGAIFRNQGFYLARHTDPFEQLVKLAREMAGAGALRHNRIRPVIEQYVFSKVSRTARLVEILDDECAKATANYVWRLQAGFTSFAITDHHIVTDAHPKDYADLLVRELNASKRLAAKSTVKAIISPRAPIDDVDRRYLQTRYDNLIGWLESVSDDSRVRFVMGPGGTVNRNICDRNVLVEGTRNPDMGAGGYQLTTISTHGPTVRSAIEVFDSLFDELWEEQARACNASGPNECREVRAHVIARLKDMKAGNR